MFALRAVTKKSSDKVYLIIFTHLGYFMTSKAALYIAHGLGLFGLALCATLLEIFDKDPGLLWFGVFLWVVFAFWESWPDQPSDVESEDFVLDILKDKGLLDDDGNAVRFTTEEGAERV